MPRMPTKDDLQQRDPRASYSIPEFRTNPIPGAIQQLGNAVSDLGGVLSQKERDEARQKAADLRKATAEREKAERYGYKSKLLQFEASQTEYLTKRGETVEPGAANFTNTSVAEYDKSAKEFFSTVPEHLKPEYDLHLQELRSRIQGGASKFEKEEGKRFTGNQVDGSLNTLLDRQRQNPASWAEVQKEGEALIDAAPHFSKIERDDKKKAWREQRVETWVKENPGEAQKLIQSKPQTSTGIVNNEAKAAPEWKSFGSIAKVDGLVIHHTAGHGTVDGVVQTFKERGYPAHYIIDREGVIHQILPDNAQGRHIKNSQNGNGMTNANTLGVEIIADDDADVLPAQVEAAKRLYGTLNQKYGLKPDQVVGHGSINSHKQATEGSTVARSIVGYSRKEGAAEGNGTADAIRNAPVASGNPRTRQLDFVVHELSTTEKNADKLLRSATTLEQAVDANLAYERPSAPARANRIKYAQSLMDGKAPKEALEARDYLKSKGYSDVQAAGFVGGLMQESGLNLDPGIPGDGGISVGIAQWNGDRRNAMEAFVGGAAGDGGNTANAGGGFQYQSIPPELEGLPHDKLMSVLGQVETANQKQRIADTTARKEALDLGIETGSVTDVNEILNADIDDGDKATLIRTFNARKDDGISASQVLGAVQNGQYLDTTDAGVKKGLNRIFNEAGGAQALVDGTEGAMATTMWAWQKSNVIAEDAKQALQTMTRSPDDGVMVRGLAYLDELQRRNPAAFDASFPEATAKTVQRYNDLNGYVPPEQLASEMRKRNDPEYIKTREPLRKIGEAEANKAFDTAAVVALFDDRGWYNPGITSAPGGPKVAGDGAMMAEDFRRLYADAYAETGDSEMAKANAFKMLNRVWSPSALNGGAITRYAPEKYYPVKNGDHAWMTELLEADLKSLGYTQEVEGIPALPMGKGPITTKVRPYSVRAMPMTEAQIFAGKQPQYSVIVTDPETGEPDLVTDKNGKPMMWPASGDTRNMLSKKATDFQKDQSGEVQWQDRLTGIDEQMKADEATGGGKLLPGPDTLQ
jgi:hypothetical protein